MVLKNLIGNILFILGALIITPPFLFLICIFFLLVGGFWIINLGTQFQEIKK